MKTFNGLFPDYATWQKLVEAPAFKKFKPESEIIELASQFIPLEELYSALHNLYAYRELRYSDEEAPWRFINKFVDEFTQLWIRTRPFITNQLGDLEEIKHRGENQYLIENLKDTDSMISKVGATSNQKESTANSTQPFNSSDIDLTTEDNLSLKTGGLINNTTSTDAVYGMTKVREQNKTDNKYNIIEDIFKVVKSKITLYLNDFVRAFNDLFIVVNAVKKPIADFTQCWTQDVLGLLFYDLKKIFKQGPNFYIKYTFDNGIPIIEFSTPGIKKDIKYEGSSLPWNQTTLFLTKLDVAGTGWIICGAEISTETTDGVIICPPGDFYQDDNFNLIIKGKIDYSVNIWQDDAKTQLFRNYQIDYNPSYITSSNTIIEVTDKTEGIDWVVTNCFKYNGKVYAMIWYIPYQATLNPGLTWNRVTIQSNTPFTEITAIKEV